MEKCKYLEKTQQRFCSEKCRKQYNRRKNPLKMVKAVTTIIGIIGIILGVGVAGSSDMAHIIHGDAPLAYYIASCGCVVIGALGQYLEVE